MTKTLEAHLRERLTDSRAMVATLDINHNRVLLHFGAIGALSRITLGITGNEIAIVSPGDLKAAWADEDSAKRSRTPLDPSEPLKARLIDGALRVGGATGPEVLLFADDGVTRLGVSLPGAADDQAPEFVSFPAGQPIAAEFDGEKVTAGGVEIELPESFFEYVARAIITDEGDEDVSEAGNGAASADQAPGGETPADATDQPLDPAPAPKNAGVWVNFENVKLDDLKAIAADEGVELAPEDNTRREIAAKINAKRGATAPAGK